MYQLPEYYAEQIDMVLNILNKYDPVGLRQLTIDNDEYELEAIEIANRSYILEINNLSKYIQEVFNFWFDEKISDDLSLKIAQDIKEQIEKTR